MQPLAILKEKQDKIHGVIKKTRTLKKEDIPRHLGRFLKRYKKILLFGFLGFLLILILIPIITYISFAGDLKDKKSITNYSKTGLTLTDREGKTFFTFDQPKEATYIPLSDMPKVLQEATVTAEDRDFYTNPGFSITGITRAFFRNLLAGRIVEGGSTISQELVKIALLNSSRNYLRKYQELVLATELNRRFSKDDILEMYLNSVYFGEGAFGIENAAQAYFGIPAKELTLSQATLLVALLPAPSALSPLSNDPERALIRQKRILDGMVEEGYITQEQADVAAATELAYNPAPQNEINTLAPHFALYVRDLLIDEYGEERVIREGFKVKTTLNSKFQAFAEQTVKNQILALRRNNAGNGAAVALDPKTGEILVMVGSFDWDDETNGRINMTLRPRQPGSSFKPIIYGLALEDKIITPSTELEDKAISYGDYKPENYDKRFRGEVTVRRALANSLNIPAVEVMDMVGVADGLKFAKQLGITTLNENASTYGLPLVLGSGEVPLLEMTNAYAVFADQGKYHPTKTVLEIKNKYDQVIEENQDKNLWEEIVDLFNPATLFQTDTSKEKIAMSDDAAFLISSILSDNAARAEVFGGALTISRPAAVKTGTTSDYKDALTIGYTPNLVVGVWVGNNDNTPMDNIAGSLGAAPIWRSLMNNFLAGTPVASFIKPSSVVQVTLCRDGQPATGSAAKEFFIRGTQPRNCDDKLTPSPTTTPTESPTPQPTNEPTNTPQPTRIPTPTKTGATPTPTSVSIPTQIITPIPTIALPTATPTP